MHLFIPRLLLATVIAFSVGCASAGSWRYRPVSKAVSDQPISNARVAVLPFEDRRGTTNRNSAALYLIPINPVGPLSYDRVEDGAGFLTHSSYQVRPSEDLAKAIVAELKAAKLFHEVFYTEREHEPEVDLFIHGRVSNMSYQGGVISYGLSVYGPNLWLLGLPSGYTTNRLSIGMELRSPEGDVEWKSSPFSDQWKVTSGLYYNWGREFDGYQEMMQRAARQWVSSLTKHLEEQSSAATASNEDDPK